MGNILDDLLRSSFFGPWVPQAGSKERVRHHYPSLAHWYESVKFMPARPDLRDAVLFCPSIKEARKFSKARQTNWRSDWNLVRHSVLIAGLGFLTLDRPDLGLRTCPVDELTKRLEAMQLPLRFLTVCVERYAQWAAGPSIGTYGANTTPESIVGRKMSKLVQANPSWTLVSMCNKKTAWRLHDWALAHYVPVQYVGNSESRVTNSLLDELVEYSSQIVVFEVRGGKGSDVVIKKTKAMRRVCVLELYRPEDMATGELPGTSTS